MDIKGLPWVLTQLMAAEQAWTVDMEGFQHKLEEQKSRSRQAAQVDAHEWTVVKPEGEATDFIGYEDLVAEVNIQKYRKVKVKKKEFFEIVLDQTPFYAESGGQVGDKGYLKSGDKKIFVEDTYRENELIIHKTNAFFDSPAGKVIAVVDEEKRRSTVSNHSATHLMHAALRKVLGEHVEQKGSLVDEKHLRFDFAHFSKMTNEEIISVERLVNNKIRENIPVDEKREVPFNEAVSMGAMALFGEKYGEHVRMIIFDKDYSLELCGGTHVAATGEIGYFKIISESAIAAGVRRIEAVTGKGAEDYVYGQKAVLDDIQEILKNAKDLAHAVNSLAEENKALLRQLDQMSREKVNTMKGSIIDHAKDIDGVNFIAMKLDVDAKTAKDLAFAINKEVDKLFLIFGTTSADKANLTLMISESLVSAREWHAGTIIRELAKEINGGGGGQPHFASAGGSNPSGFEKAFSKAEAFVRGK